MTRAWVAGPLLTLEWASQGQRFPQNVPAQSPHPSLTPSQSPSSRPSGSLSHQAPLGPLTQPSSQDAAAMGGGGRGMVGCPSLIRKVPNTTLGDQLAAKPQGM